MVNDIVLYAGGVLVPFLSYHEYTEEDCRHGTPHRGGLRQAQGPRGGQRRLILLRGLPGAAGLL
ncbi:MAG: hypothetical protein V8R40_14515 [Dysosmobacter sp.]